MTVEPAGTKYIIEPLDPSKHDRGAFSCGIEQVDNYFRKTANKLAKSDNVRVHCMVGSSGQVIGFTAINAHSVHFSKLPDRFARNRPSHGQIPAAYISMIGVASNALHLRRAQSAFACFCSMCSTAVMQSSSSGGGDSIWAMASIRSRQTPCECFYRSPTWKPLSRNSPFRRVEPDRRRLDPLVS